MSDTVGPADVLGENGGRTGSGIAFEDQEPAVVVLEERLHGGEDVVAADEVDRLGPDDVRGGDHPAPFAE
ncbi:hypothetical protein [Streptomyces sp.]|uniref:hypothetical protein n=1 Tax=Streptomyces sp. TaxID=1931 RepID=UPI002D76E82F|nr:hypothetical protein [Streptomyces sp.]HET6357763.1 hypothetical protein [Streptomyces sp.]